MGVPGGVAFSYERGTPVFMLRDTVLNPPLQAGSSLASGAFEAGFALRGTELITSHGLHESR